ncbi:MAG: hypothetical protein R3B82_26700, partial [Sandaracinaceae bacterium]
ALEKQAAKKALRRRGRSIFETSLSPAPRLLYSRNIWFLREGAENRLECLATFASKSETPWRLARPTQR